MDTWLIITRHHHIYFGLCWLSLGLAMLLLTVGLWHVSITPSEKGFYAMSFLLSLFAAVAVQKNIRNLLVFKEESFIHEIDASNGQAI